MSNKSGLPRSEAGQSFFEVIVAIGLISIVLITLVTLAAASIRASTFSRNQTQASRFTEQATEWLRDEKDANWTIFKARATNPNWCLDTLTWLKGTTCSANDLISGTNFTRFMKLTVIDPNTVQADVQTTWTDAQGTHSTPSSIIFTNWK